MSDTITPPQPSRTHDVHTLWAHTILTLAAVASRPLHPYFLAGVVVLACGWVTPTGSQVTPLAVNYGTESVLPRTNR